MEKQTVIVASYLDQFEANYAKNQLDNQSVDCFVADESTISINPLLASALGGYKLYVGSDDLDKAKKILRIR